MRFSVIFPLLSLLSVTSQSTSGCPNVCICKWKNGKQTVECRNKNLQEVPDGIDSGSQVLDLTGSKLTELSKDIFVKKQITNLQRIYLGNCKIKSINGRAFNGLTNLVELDLSNNLLESVPTDAFSGCPALMRLILNLNPIKLVKKLAFNHLSYLNSLELNNCEISNIEEGAFQGLQSLEWLRLDGNKLKTMPGRRTLPDNLKGIELQGNEWECDCHIQDLHAWLHDFNIPQSVEPTCTGPPRLAGRMLKSISNAELACLPDISPTTFYLELGEGKNVSLLCHVHAVPEATVSWWFQGQMLQNNTLVAPGVHLIYFVEEGSEKKRSELFIYNANAEDNGTFICNAENAAGTSQSNFTIRILLKEDPIVIIVSFPFEYLLAAVVGAGILCFVVLIMIIISIVKCHKRRKRQKVQEKNKDVSLHYQQNTEKCASLRENIETIPDPHKMSSNTLNCGEDMMLYGAQPQEEFFRTMSPATMGNQVRSPSSLRRYQLEQNPDLINGTESIGCRREGDGEDVQDREPSERNEQVSPLARHGMIVAQHQLPIACLRGSREFYKDMRCEPACVLDPEGYPIDYGLPKIPCRSQCHENYYRTLPCNRIKRQSAANPINRYSREAEFLSRNDQPAPLYDHFHTDVRYTADGYPAKHAAAAATTNLPSPPDSFRSDTGAPSSLPCCSVKWPACVPANLHMINPSLEYNNQSKYANKRCVGAQTEAGVMSEQQPNAAQYKTESSNSNVQNDPVNEVLTESPDEGYEGEPSVV